MILYFDTALSGRYQYRKADDAAVQPHLARLSMLVVTEQGNEILERSHLIAPDAGWHYEVEAIAAHHISPAIAAEQGIALADALLPFVQALAEATQVVAFNYDHHRRAMIRAGFDVGLEIDMPAIDDDRAFDAMRRATEYTKVPAMRPGGGYLWPKMHAAYAYFAGTEMTQSLDPVDQGLLNLRAIRMIHTGIMERERVA